MYLGMSLREWLDETNTTMEKAGELCGRAQSIISRLVNHRHRPDPETAKRLVAMSRGNITLNELYGLPMKHRCKCEQDTIKSEKGERRRAGA